MKHLLIWIWIHEFVASLHHQNEHIMFLSFSLMKIIFFLLVLEAESSFATSEISPLGHASLPSDGKSLQEIDVPVNNEITPSSDAIVEVSSIRMFELVVDTKLAKAREEIARMKSQAQKEIDCAKAEAQTKN